jgi:ATP-dependent Clp protease ATP-binding subunit ClpA
LSSGKLRCIGATTYEEFRGIFEKDRALARRFQKVDINEPTQAECVQILKGLKTQYESHHNVKYTLPAIKEAVAISARYITERHLPDKAIDVIDEAGAKQRLLPPSKRKKTINVTDVESIVASIARIPPKTVSLSDKDVLRNLERDLKMVVFGQDMAISTLATAIKMSRSGLGNQEKPIGSFLFAGPTGVGKTEVTRQLAKILGIELIRFDMSEYMERHTVSRLIGAPPGYVGYDESGQLTEAVRRKPYSVVLLDEIEKAHPDVFNILLQVLDDGRLTDNKGRLVNFKNAIIIMTSNIGSLLIQEQLGAQNGSAEEEKFEKTRLEVFELLKRTIRPEFLNRVDEIIMFRPLSEKQIYDIAGLQLKILQKQLRKNGIDLLIDESSVAWIAHAGFDPQYGARPVKRVIQRSIVNELSKMILAGKVEKDQAIRIIAQDGGIAFNNANANEVR